MPTSPSAKPVKAQLSSQVIETNDVIMKELQRYRAIDRRQRDRYKELEEVDCADMLKTANVQIKVMN